MAVASEFQRNGVGKLIVKTLLKKCHEFAVEKVELSASITALKFYKKLNFVPFGEVFASKKTGALHQKMCLELK